MSKFFNKVETISLITKRKLLKFYIFFFVSNLIVILYDIFNLISFILFIRNKKKQPKQIKQFGSPEHYQLQSLLTDCFKLIHRYTPQFKLEFTTQ